MANFNLNTFLNDAVSNTQSGSSVNPLPYTSVPSNRPWMLKRNIIQWYIPQIGIIKMYINPQRMSFGNTKNVTPERTKGGYSINYFGENLSTISIGGNTGTSGIEGINVLYEVYRAEQYLFDQNANLINSNNNQNLVQSITGFIGNQIGGSTGIQVANIINDVSGINDPMNMMQLNPRNMTTLADIAFGIELYYSGWIMRGYFTSFNITESADSFLINYDIGFTVTQKRGYRTNIHPFQRSPNGPSEYNSNYSFDPSDGTNVSQYSR